MKNDKRIFLLLGTFFGFTGVALGAFGSHGLKSILPPDMLAVFETAVRYQMYHAFALIAAGLLLQWIDHRSIRLAGWFFTVGIILFSGSLYAMTVTGIRTFGFITPFGGVCFLLGWLFLFLSVATTKKEN